MNREPISILIVEDHAVVRRGLKEIITDVHPKAVFGEAIDSATAVQEYYRCKWDIVLLDINIPGRGGLDVLADIRHTDPQARVLIVSAFRKRSLRYRPSSWVPQVT